MKASPTEDWASAELESQQSVWWQVLARDGFVLKDMTWAYVIWRTLG